MTLTRDEIVKDLADSQRDLDNVRMAIDGIKGFIVHNAGEDRNFLKVDLMRWENLLIQGARLHKRIEDALEKATP